MQENITKRKVLKKWVRISLVIVIIVIAIAAFYIISRSFNTLKTKEENISYFYKVNQNIDYKVNLYDNSFIDSTSLGKGEMYISDLVRNIEADMSYKYSGSKIIPLKYDYTVIATISGKYQLDDDDPDLKLWTKEYVIKEKRTIDVSDKTNITINEKVPIDYKFYNGVVSNFRQELKLSIQATLNVKLKVNVYGEINGEKVTDSKEIYIELPLNQQAFTIEENYEQEYSNVILDKNNLPKVDKRQLISGIIIIAIDIALFVVLFRSIFNIQKKNNYTIRLNKILKDYGDIIIEITTPVSSEDLSIIEVKNFNEMIDLEEEIRIPIMFYETEEYYEGEFILIHNNLLYKYVLTNDEE